MENILKVTKGNPWRSQRKTKIMKDSIAASVMAFCIIVLIVIASFTYFVGINEQEKDTAKFLCKSDKILTIYNENDHTYAICNDEERTKVQID
jgi:hypothetical protein